MFWSGNYMVVRELNCLLKEENVTLTQVLEADDILQECQADNKALMQFLTKPKILAELITLITEEPPKHVELASQYRHASIACEVLTSHLSTLSDRLSMDVVQMNRLCDFINRDPPLNPLLASYFSKTVEMLLERSPKQASPAPGGGALAMAPELLFHKVLRNLCFAQDWYIYHMVCLRVLDFFKSRRDFLPNLLRHISTSAIADTFKYFIRLDDLFNKIIMEWFEEHQFLECLIQIICGTYVPEPLARAGSGAGAGAAPDLPEKGQLEPSEKAHANHAPHNHADQEGVENNVEESKEVSEPATAPEKKPEGGSAAAAAAAAAQAEAAAEAETRAARIAAVASANAAALLCDLILSGCAGDGYNTRARTSWALVSRLAGAGAAQLLGGMFTAPPPARRHALVHGAHVLLALIDHEPTTGGEYEAERTSVECAIAPHLPLLHQALLQAPAGGGAGVGGGGDGAGVGLARVQVAALLAHLALSEVHDVCSTIITLRTPAVVLDLMFAHEHNNFMHAQAHALVRHALANRVYRTQYARHLLVECDLLTRLMDAFEENENKEAGTARSGYMGHVIEMLRAVGRALREDAALHELLAPPALRRYADLSARLAAVLQRHDTPLGGYYPSENAYEFNECGTAGAMDDAGAPTGDDAREIGGPNDPTDFLADELDIDDNEKMENKGNFLELASQRFSDDMWEDSPAADADADADPDADAGADGCPIDQVMEVLAVPSPWEGAAGAGGGEGWAQFDAPANNNYFWPYSDENSSESELSPEMAALSLTDSARTARLASKLLTAMADMPPEIYQAVYHSQDPFEDSSAPEPSPASPPPHPPRPPPTRGGARPPAAPDRQPHPVPEEPTALQDSTAPKDQPLENHTDQNAPSGHKDQPVLDLTEQNEISASKEQPPRDHSDQNISVQKDQPEQNEIPVQEEHPVGATAPDSADAAGADARR